MAGGLAWAACVVAICAALAPGMAEAQQYTGVLWLDPVPSTASAGDQVRFSGSLTTASGHSVRDATIHIKDNVSFGRDATMMTLRTDSSGYFSGTWTARERSSGAWDFYAVFEGSGDVRKARSSEYSVTVYPGRSGSPDAGPRQYEGVLRLDRIPSTATAGDLVRFSGSLTTTSGHFVPGATVRIKDNVSFGSDDTIMSLVTGPSGQFSGTWTARERSSGAWDFYAEFRGSQQVTSARSSEYSMTVSGGGYQAPEPSGPYSTVTRLNAVQRAAGEGDRVTFTGTVTSGDGQLIGARVLVKEDVALAPDRTLGSGSTDSSGRFSISWTVEPGSASGRLDIYAEFAGSSGYSKSQSARQGMHVEAAPSAHGTSTSLDRPPARVIAGEPVTFTGRVTSGGQGVPGSYVLIKEDDPLARDEVLAAGWTDQSGRFSISWVAREALVEVDFDVYAEHQESGAHEASQSGRRTMSVLEAAASQVTLDAPPSSVRAGDAVTFTGRAEAGGAPLAGARVEIREDDPLLPDQLLASGSTGSDGRFAITWDVAAGLVERDFDVYAELIEDASHYKSQTPRHVVKVTKYGGSLSLDPLPASARMGEPVTFSGTLSLEGHNPEGAVVYVKDEDQLNFDDLLATAYVGSDGRFSATWFASDVDPDPVVDIYAVFEGDGKLGRLTTCDTGVTFDLGGLCRDTIPLTILPAGPPGTPPRPGPDPPRPGPDPPRPGPDPPDGTGYMEMFYSVDTPGTPHVMIVPSPDSYDRVRGHIGPAMEGIRMWSGLLGEKHGGDWNVRIDVLPRNAGFMGERPDIIMNIVDHDDHQECVHEFYGWAYIKPTPIFPVQTYVCSTSLGVTRSNAGVVATAGHEFIHAMGLGHTFGRAGDLMCSKENGKLTCPNLSSKSRVPSDLNLSAIAKIYGRDGYQVPNNNVEFRSKFHPGDPIGGGERPKVPEPDSITVSTDKPSYVSGEIIRVSGTARTQSGFSIVTSTVAGSDGRTIHTKFSQMDGSGRFGFEMDAGGLIRNHGTYTVSSSVTGSSAEPAEAEFQFGSAPRSTAGPAVTKPPTKAFEKGIRITDDTIRIQVWQKEIDGAQMGPRVLTGSMLTSHGSEMDVDLAVYTQSGTCVIGPGCMVSESTRGPGKIHEVVVVDGINLKVRYSGPDARIERFDILDASGGFLEDGAWRVDVLKEDQPSRLYYKVTYRSVE